MLLPPAAARAETSESGRNRLAARSRASRSATSISRATANASGSVARSRTSQPRAVQAAAAVSGPRSSAPTERSRVEVVPIRSPRWSPGGPSGSGPAAPGPRSSRTSQPTSPWRTQPTMSRRPPRWLLGTRRRSRGGQADRESRAADRRRDADTHRHCGHPSQTDVTSSSCLRYLPCGAVAHGPASESSAQRPEPAASHHERPSGRRVDSSLGQQPWQVLARTSEFPLNPTMGPADPTVRGSRT